MIITREGGRILKGASDAAESASEVVGLAAGRDLDAGRTWEPAGKLGRGGANEKKTKNLLVFGGAIGHLPLWGRFSKNEKNPNLRSYFLLIHI